MRFTAKLPGVHLGDFDTIFRGIWRKLAVKHPIHSDDGSLAGFNAPGVLAVLTHYELDATGRHYSIKLDTLELVSVSVMHFSRVFLTIEVIEIGRENYYFFPNIVQWLKDEFSAEETEHRVQTPLGVDILLSIEPPKRLPKHSSESESSSEDMQEEIVTVQSLTRDQLIWLDRVKQGIASGNVVEFCKGLQLSRQTWYDWKNRFIEMGILHDVSGRMQRIRTSSYNVRTPKADTSPLNSILKGDKQYDTVESEYDSRRAADS